MSKNIPLFGFHGLVDPIYSTNYKDELKVSSYLLENTNTIVGNSGVLMKRPGWTATHSLGKIFGKTVVKKLTNFQPYEPSTVDVENDAIDEKTFTSLNDLKEFAGYNRILPVKFPKDLEVASVRSYNPSLDFVAPTIFNSGYVREEDRSDYLIDTGISKHCIEHEDQSRRISLGGINSGLKYTQPRYLTHQETSIDYVPTVGATLHSELKTVVVDLLKTVAQLLEEVLERNKAIEEFASDTLDDVYDETIGGLHQRRHTNYARKAIKVDLESIGFKKQAGNTFKVFTGTDYEGVKYADNSFMPSGVKSINNLYLLCKEGHGFESEYRKCMDHYGLPDQKIIVVKTNKDSKRQEVFEIALDDASSIYSAEYSNIDATVEVYLVLESQNWRDVVAQSEDEAASDTKVVPDFHTLVYVLNTAIDAPIEFPILASVGSDYKYVPGEEIIKDCRILPTFQTTFLRNTEREKRSLFDQAYDKSEFELGGVTNTQTDMLVDEGQPYVTKIGSDSYKITNTNVVVANIPGLPTVSLMFGPLFDDHDYNSNYDLPLYRIKEKIYFCIKQDATILPVDLTFYEQSDVFPLSEENVSIWHLMNEEASFDQSTLNVNVRGLDNKYHVDRDLYRFYDDDEVWGEIYRQDLYRRSESVFNNTINGKQKLKLVFDDLYDRLPNSPFTRAITSSFLTKFLSNFSRPKDSEIRLYKLDEDRIPLAQGKTYKACTVQYSNNYTGIDVQEVQIYKKNNQTQRYEKVNWQPDLSLSGIRYTLVFKSAVQGSGYSTLSDWILSSFDANAPSNIAPGVAETRFAFVPGSLYLMIIPSEEEGAELYDNNLHIVYGEEQRASDISTRLKSLSIPDLEPYSTVHHVPNVESLRNYLDYADLPDGVDDPWFQEEVPDNLTNLSFTTTSSSSSYIVVLGMSVAMWELNYYPPKIYQSALISSESVNEQLRDLFLNRIAYLKRLRTAYQDYRYTKKDLEEIKLLPLHSKAFSNLLEDKDTTLLKYPRNGSFDSYKTWNNSGEVSLCGYSLDDLTKLDLVYYNPVIDREQTISLNELFSARGHDYGGVLTRSNATINREGELIKSFRIGSVTSELNELANGRNPNPFLPLLRCSKKVDFCKIAFASGRHRAYNLFVKPGVLVTPSIYFEPRIRYSTSYSKRYAETINELFPYDMNEAYLGIVPCGYDDNGKPLYPQNIKIVSKKSDWTHETISNDIKVIEHIETPDYGDGVHDLQQDIKSSINSQYNSNDAFDADYTLNDNFTLKSNTYEYINNYTAGTDISNKVVIRSGRLIQSWLDTYIKNLGPVLSSSSLSEFKTKYKANKHIKALSLFDALTVNLNSFRDFVHPLVRIARKDENGILHVIPYANPASTDVLAQDTSDAHLMKYFEEAQTSGAWSYFMPSKPNEYNIVKNTLSRTHGTTHGYVFGDELCNYIWSISYQFLDRWTWAPGFPTDTEFNFLDFSAYGLDRRRQSWGHDRYSTILDSYYDSTLNNTEVLFMIDEYELFNAVEAQSSRLDELMAMIILDLDQIAPSSSGSKFSRLEGIVSVGLDIPNFDAEYLPPVVRTKRDAAVALTVGVDEGEQGVSLITDFIGKDTGVITTYFPTISVESIRVLNPIDWSSLGYSIVGTGDDSEYVKYTNTAFARLQEEGADNSLWFKLTRSQILATSFRDPESVYFKLSQEQLHGLDGNPFYDIDGQSSSPIVVKIKYDQDAVHELLISKDVITQERSASDGSGDLDHYLSPYVNDDTFSIVTAADGTWSYGDISRTKSLQMLLGDHQLGHFNRSEPLAGAKWFNIGSWFNVDYNDYREKTQSAFTTYQPPLEADATDETYETYPKVGTIPWQTIQGNESVITLGKYPYKQIQELGNFITRRRGMFDVSDKNLPVASFKPDGTNMDLTTSDYITQVWCKSNSLLSASPYFSDIGVVAVLKLQRDSAPYSTLSADNVESVHSIKCLVTPSSVDFALSPSDTTLLRVKALTEDEETWILTDEAISAYALHTDLAHNSGIITRHDQPREIIQWLEDTVNLADGEAEVILKDNWVFFEVKFRRHLLSKAATVTLSVGDDKTDYRVQPSVIDYDNLPIHFEEGMILHENVHTERGVETTYSPDPQRGLSVERDNFPTLYHTGGSQYAGRLGIGERPITIHRDVGDSVLGNLALSIPVDVVGLTAKTDEQRLYQDITQLIADVEAGTKTINDDNPVKLTMTLHNSADTRLIGGQKKASTQESLFILKEQEGSDLYLPSEERVISTTREEMFANIDSLLGNFNIDSVSVGNSGDTIYLVDSKPIEGDFQVSGIPGTGFNSYMQKLYYTAKLKTKDSDHLEFDAVPVKQIPQRKVLRQNEIDFSSLPLLRSIIDAHGTEIHESWNLPTNNAERQQTLNYLRDNMRLYELDMSIVDNETVNIFSILDNLDVDDIYFHARGANFTPTKWLKLKNGKFFLPKFRLVKKDKSTNAREVLQFEKGAAASGKNIENSSVYLILSARTRYEGFKPYGGFKTYGDFTVARISNYVHHLTDTSNPAISYPDYKTYGLINTPSDLLAPSRLNSVTARSGEDAEWFESNISSILSAHSGTRFKVFVGFIPDENDEFPEHVEAIYTEAGNDDPITVPATGAVIKTIAPEFKIGDYMYSHVFYRNERLVLADTIDKPGYYNFSEFGKYDSFIPDVEGELGKSSFEWHLPNKVWSGKIVLFNNDILTFYEKGIYRWEGTKLQVKAIETGIKEIDTRDININVEPVIYGDEVFFIDSENSIRTLVKHPNIASGDYIVLKDKLEVPAKMQIKQLCVATIADTTVELVLTDTGDIYCHNKMCSEKQPAGYYSPAEGWSKWDTGSNNFPLGKIVHIENVNSVVTAIAVDDANNGYILQLDENSTMDIPFGHKNITLKQLQNTHNKFDEDSSHTERFIGRDLYYKSADGSIAGKIKELFEDFDKNLQVNKEYGTIPGNKWFLTTNKVHRQDLDEDLCDIGFSIKVRVETAPIPQITRSGVGNITNRQECFSIENVHVGLSSAFNTDIYIKEKSITPETVETKYGGEFTYISGGAGKMPFSGENEVVKYPIGGKKFGDGIIIVECDSIEPFSLNSIVREISVDGGRE